MLINTPLPSDGYRHNYIRLVFVFGTLLLFIGHIVTDQLTRHRTDRLILANETFHAEDLVVNDITPSNWVFRCLDALSQLWQLAWLFYSLTFIFRRSTTGYLYLSPKTFTPTFYIFYTFGFLIQTIWFLLVSNNSVLWSWIIYLASFLILSLALFIINNNVDVNKKIYETEGLNHDIWCLRFFAQNGVAFFACWTALRFVLSFNTFLYLKTNLTAINTGTISLVLAAILAATFFFGPNFNATLTTKCAYQFSPWIIFIFFFWGVMENNWIPRTPSRNNIIALVELVASLVSAIGALALFTLRYRAAKIDPIA